MIDEIKILLGDAAENFTDAQIGLCAKLALAEVEEYCGRSVDYVLELVAERIAVIKLKRLDTEGLSSQSFSGISESFISGYPDDIQKILNKKRKIKVV